MNIAVHSAEVSLRRSWLSLLTQAVVDGCSVSPRNSEPGMLNEEKQTNRGFWASH